MPRARPFTCHKCGAQYTGARCPVCYPPKAKRRRGGGSRARRGRTAAQVLRLAELPAVNLAALPERAGEIDYARNHGQGAGADDAA